MFKAIEPIYGHFAGNKKTNLSSCCVPNCEVEALAVAAAMEKGTTHPIGRYVIKLNSSLCTFSPCGLCNSICDYGPLTSY